MKKLFTIAILVMLSIACVAQSSEAGYPVGTWQSDPEKADVFVDLTIERILPLILILEIKKSVEL